MIAPVTEVFFAVQNHAAEHVTAACALKASSDALRGNALDVHQKVKTRRAAHTVRRFVHKTGPCAVQKRRSSCFYNFCAISDFHVQTAQIVVINIGDLHLRHAVVNGSLLMQLLRNSKRRVQSFKLLLVKLLIGDACIIQLLGIRKKVSISSDQVAAACKDIGQRACQFRIRTGKTFNIPRFADLRK